MIFSKQYVFSFKQYVIIRFFRRFLDLRKALNYRESVASHRFNVPLPIKNMFRLLIKTINISIVQNNLRYVY